MFSFTCHWRRAIAPVGFARASMSLARVGLESRLVPREWRRGGARASHAAAGGGGRSPPRRARGTQGSLLWKSGAARTRERGFLRRRKMELLKSPPPGGLVGFQWLPSSLTLRGGAATHPTCTSPLSLSAGLYVLAPLETSSSYRTTLSRPLGVVRYVLVSPVTSAQKEARLELHPAGGVGCTSGAATPAPDVHRASAARCRSVRGPLSRNIGCPSCPPPRPRPLGRFSPMLCIPWFSDQAVRLIFMEC